MKLSSRDRVIQSFLVASLLLGGISGCTSLGVTLWPSQFTLLPQTRSMAAAAPIPSGMPHELANLDLENYFVEPGDRILIEATDLQSDIGSFGDQKIQIDGSIDLGKFGRLRISGMTIEDIELMIQNRLAIAGQTETINVQLIETNAARVYVLGEVGSPAAYPLNGNEHVLDVILRAGGLTSKASPCHIVLVRPTGTDACRVVLPVCYRQITQLGDVTTNYQLQPGDRVIVGSRPFCEELMWWKQSTACNRCSRSCCVECQPADVQYDRRFVARLTSFLIPDQPQPETETRPEPETVARSPEPQIIQSRDPD